jgi:hypothetical protein
MDGAARVALFEALPEEIRAHPPAAVELGSALLDLAGRAGGAGSHYARAERCRPGPRTEGAGPTGAGPLRLGWRCTRPGAYEMGTSAKTRKSR